MDEEEDGFADVMQYLKDREDGRQKKITSKPQRESIKRMLEISEQGKVPFISLEIKVSKEIKSRTEDRFESLIQKSSDGEINSKQRHSGLFQQPCLLSC